ncbi:hypothetical protein [Pinisolibacter sp.]|uniref:hypothetical protein n=1 Tax=Pinisolibacter sp. TaxID=2172024 RepID=UPI002FDCDBAE
MSRRRPIPVTDHAVLRWLERVEGFDVEALRAEIGRAGAVGVEHGAGVVVVPGGKLIVYEGRVVTVYPRDASESRPDRYAFAEAIVSLQGITPVRRPKRRRRS